MKNINARCPGLITPVYGFPRYVHLLILHKGKRAGHLSLKQEIAPKKT